MRVLILHASIASFPGEENSGLVSIQTLSLNLIRIGLMTLGLRISQFMTLMAMKGVTYVFPEVSLEVYQIMERSIRNNSQQQHMRSKVVKIISTSPLKLAMLACT